MFPILLIGGFIATILVTYGLAQLLDGKSKRQAKLESLEARHNEALWEFHRNPNDEMLERLARETGLAYFEAKNRDVASAYDMTILEENLALARDFPPPSSDR